MAEEGAMGFKNQSLWVRRLGSTPPVPGVRARLAESASSPDTKQGSPLLPGIF